jgi:predicted ribosome quality control (RQC) complex YloA/Tae2 family protein
MDSKAISNNKKKINELAIQHNKLTTLVACLLNEIGSLKKDLSDLRGGDNTQRNINESISNNGNRSSSQNNNNKFTNFNELRAEDILKQLSINSSDN